MQNKIIVYIIVIVVLISGAFYGGMKYGGMKYGQGTALEPQPIQSLSQAQRQQVFVEVLNENSKASGGKSSLGGNGFANGQIITQTDQSITVKLLDGNSKIILLADSTKINKSVDGQKTDLVIGKQVSVNGTVNTDGTITAKTITLTSLLPITPANSTNQNKLTPTP